jgi:signal recognition particle receptor subunit beta
MALFNYATRELSAKIVYYGPGLSGKTTNIEMVHQLLKPEQKGRLISLPTETDRTLFFDFLPLDLGQIKGFKVRFHLYTVPGQVYYNATRRLVLQGVDGVVFVADSQVDMLSSNVDSLKNLRENLATYGKKLEDLPFVMQYNKRDLRKVASPEELNQQLNDLHVPVFEGVAKDGVGVAETLVAISRLVFAHLRKTLLLPGDAADSVLEGEIADVTVTEKPSAEAPEPLEEISEIEEIPDLAEAPAAEGVEQAVEAVDPVTGEGGLDEAPELQEIPETTEVPEGVEMIVPPQEVAPPAPAGAEEAEAEAEASPVGEAAEPSEEVPDEIEIEIPEVFDEPEPAGHPAVSVEAEGEELSFLKFEDVRVSPEGDAVLPAVFLDAAGNPVRIRICISVGKGPA